MRVCFTNSLCWWLGKVRNWHCIYTGPSGYNSRALEEKYTSFSLWSVTRNPLTRCLQWINALLRLCLYSTHREFLHFPSLSWSRPSIVTVTTLMRPMLGYGPSRSVCMTWSKTIQTPSPANPKTEDCDQALRFHLLTSLLYLITRFLLAEAISTLSHIPGTCEDPAQW